MRYRHQNREPIKPFYPGARSISAGHLNQLVDGVNELSKARQSPDLWEPDFSGDEAAATHPFKMSYNSATKTLSISAGMWIGDGISARGCTVGTNFNPTESGTTEKLPFFAFRDTFFFDVQEVDLSAYGGTVYIFVDAYSQNGRVIGSTEDATETKAKVVVAVAQSGSTDFEKWQKGAWASRVCLGWVDVSAGTVTQIIKDNILYPPVPGACAPLVFHPVHGEINQFSCKGGLLKINLHTVDGYERNYSANNPINSEGTRWTETLIPEKGRRFYSYFAPIPAHLLSIGDPIQYAPNTDNGGYPVHGYLVYLRVTAAYSNPDIYTSSEDSGIEIPTPTIAWASVAIPNDGASISETWSFPSERQLTSPDYTTKSLYVHSFLAEKAENGQPILSKLDLDFTENFDAGVGNLVAVMQKLEAETDAFTTIIPVGILYPPFPTNQNLSNPSGNPWEERFVYLPIEQGVINWTPPIHLYREKRT